MQNAPGISNWDGHLPPHIAKNEQIWWEVLSRIRFELPPKLLQLLPGVAKQSPSREMIGKVVLVATTREELRAKFGIVGGSLLNHWGCYCTQMIDEGQTVYMAGTVTKPYLNFSVSFGSFASVCLRFCIRVDRQLNLSSVELEKLDQSLKGTVKELGILEDCEVEISSFQRGPWENGLDIAFNAAVWLSSNREEALASIWKVQASGKDLRSL